MSDTQNHPGRERLQAFVEASLDEAAARAVDAHLTVCPRCSGDVEELQSLFEVLSSLTRFAPATGFADRIMARVRVRQPWLVRVADWVEQFTPRTTRGWAVAAAVLALPVIGATLLSWWLISQPGVTPQGLWLVASEVTGQALSTSWDWGWARFTESRIAAWLIGVTDLAATLGTGGLGLAVVMFASFTAGSVWILYQNLFRPEARRTDYASYVF